ncbi:AsmA family protein [Candidatus Omnitrophota bacterium]
MKKFFIVIIFVFLIAAIALFVFILTFDANQYKPLLTEKIQEAIQKDIRISNISLNIFPRALIVVHGVAIKDVNKTWDDVILKADSIEANVKLLPLIKRDVEIERLTIKGLDIAITKDAISSIGSIDVASMPFFDIRLSVIEATLKNVSLYGPIDVDAKLSVFARGTENIKLKALLYPEFENKEPCVKNLDIRIALDRISLTTALKALGRDDISQRLIGGKEIAGELIVRSQKIVFDPEKISRSNIYMDLSNGATDLLPIKDGVKDIELRAEIAGGDIAIQKFTGSLCGGNFSAKGVAKDICTVQALDLDLTLRDINISSLFPNTAPGDPYLEGALNVGMQSSARGLTGQKIMDSLIAGGTIKLDEPVLRNMNVLTVIFDKLDMLPGLVRKLKRKLPDYYKELLKQDYTTFKTLEIDFDIKEGKMFFQKDIGLESDAFYLVANGYLDIYSSEAAKGFSNLFIPQDLSNVFIEVVDELGYLRTHHGMITIPLDIGGRFPDISITPDIGYVIQKLTVSKSQELIEGIFRKREPKETGDREGTEPGDEEQDDQVRKEQEKVEPTEALIRTIFDIIAAPQD